MRKLFCTAFALLLIDGGLAAAAPLSPLPSAKGPIVLVANGCGRNAFRTADGECVPKPEGGGMGRNGRVPPPCPRGYLRDPDPARPLCYPAY